MSATAKVQRRGAQVEHAATEENDAAGQNCACNQKRVCLPVHETISNQTETTSNPRCEDLCTMASSTVGHHR